MLGAHARGKFFGLYEAHASPIAKQALDKIGALYDIETQIRGRPAEERQRIRTEQARLLLESLHGWMKV